MTACSADRKAPVEDLARPAVDPPAGHVQQVYGSVEAPDPGSQGLGVLDLHTAGDGTTYVVDDPEQPSPGEEALGSPRTAVLDLERGTANRLEDYSIGGEEFERPTVDAVGSDGSLYVVALPSSPFPRLHVRSPDGVWSEPGVLSERCRFSGGRLSVGPDAALYRVCGGEVLRSVPGGSEQVVAGREMTTGQRPPVAPVDTATRPGVGASLPFLSSVVPAPDGSLYVLSDGTVHLLSPDGELRLLAGPGTPAEPGAELVDDPPFVPGQSGYGFDDGTRLRSAALGKDGSLYLSDVSPGRLLVLPPDGRLRLLRRTPDKPAGPRATDDAVRRPVPVEQAAMYPSSLAVLPDGDLLIADGYRVLRLGVAG